MVDTRGGKVTPPETVAYYNWNYTGAYSAGITLGTPADWFGPLNPQAPSAPPEVSGRRFDFPSGYNLNILPRAYEPVKFEDLRALADGYDILRLLIETRKDQMATGSWQIKPRNDAQGKNMTEPDDPIIKEITQFFEMPDGENFWDTWLRMMLEDMFVIDAPALFCQRARNGKLLALQQVDGATIKRVIDDWGRTPPFPAPAYQQDLHGLPAVNYTTDDMYYRPRNQRIHKVYGYSPVEQILMTINIALRRQVFLLQYYTEGNIPEALIGAPDNWTTKQIEEFQEWFDSILVGETAVRRRLRFIPGGAAKQHIDLKSGALTDATDEWLTRVCCFAMSITPTPFIKAMNRATADSAKEQALQEGLEPIQRWVKQYIDFIIRKEWYGGKQHQVEFDWTISSEIEPKEEMETLTGYVKGGILAVNEARAKIGEDPVEGGEFPMALTPAGWSPLDANLQAQRNDTITPVQLQQPDGGQEPDGNQPAGNEAGGDQKPPASSQGGGKGKEPAPAKKPTGVGKVAGVPFGIARLRKGVVRRISVDPHRRAVTDAKKALAKVWKEHLPAIGKQVANAIRPELATIERAADPDQARRAAEIASGVDLSGLNILIDPTADALQSMMADSASEVVTQFGELAATDLFERVNLNAVVWARQRAAELVGKTIDENGNVVDNPNAKMAIDDTTRQRIQDTITEGLANGDGNQDITDRIEEIGFSEERAQLIAFTEIARANSQGALESYKEARNDGVNTQKEWLTAQDDLVCEEICQENEDDGPIDLDDDFSSGDDAPPGHPNCRCRVVAVVTDDSGGEDEGGDL